MSVDCIFCKIANKEIQANIAHETDSAIAFHDLNPQAPVHILVIPKKHVDGIAAASDEDDLQGVLLTAAETAKMEGLDKTGYRLVINHGAHAGQSIYHLHVHLLGGRVLTWPPG